MMSVDIDQKFKGLDITFYDQQDHTHSQRLSKRHRRAINYAWAKISVHYEKTVLADYFVDVPVWTASIESRVHMAARNSIKNAPIALVRTSHNPKVTVFMDVEYMPAPEIAPGPGHHHDDDKHAFENDHDTTGHPYKEEDKVPTGIKDDDELKKLFDQWLAEKEGQAP